MKHYFFVTAKICHIFCDLDSMVGSQGNIFYSLGLNVKYVEVSLQTVVMQEDMLKLNIWIFLLPVLSVVNY